MTTIEQMKQRLTDLQASQWNCVDKYECVRPIMRERYIILTREAKKTKECIEYLTEHTNIK